MVDGSEPRGPLGHVYDSSSAKSDAGCNNKSEAAGNKIPQEYLDFKSVFEKSSADRLPSHGTQDCSIDITPNDRLPSALSTPCRR